MALRFPDNVRHAIPTTGTGPLTLGSAPAGWQTVIAAGVSDGDSIPYLLEEGPDQEWGHLLIGDSGTSGVRTVKSSTNSNNPLDLQGGAILTCVLLGSDLEELIGASDAQRIKGGIDCSENPNYPAADCGDTYKVTVAGRIGGGSGPVVEVGDAIICINDGTSSGTEASVGANWFILQANLSEATTSVPGFVRKASTSDVYASAVNRFLAGDNIESASAYVAMAETGASPTLSLANVDWEKFINAEVTLSDSRQISNPVNGQPGTYRCVKFVGNNATLRTITFGNQFLGELPDISDCNNATGYEITIKCITASWFSASAKRILGS